MNQDEQREHGRRLIEEARRTNIERDAEDREHGFAAPGAGPYLLLQTALTAIEAGILTGDWPCVAEGYVMLQDFTRKLLAATEGR